MNQKNRTTVRVERGGQTLAAIVRGALDVPWSKAKELCTSGRVWVDGDKASDPAVRVADGAKVEVQPHGRRDRRGLFPKDQVLHEDVDLVVVNKPSNTLTLPYRDERDTLADQVRAYLRRDKRARRDPMVGVVQRLDRDTTGVMVFARNMKAKRALEEQFRAHTVHRRYVALVHGDARGATYRTDIVQDRGDGLRGSWGTHRNHQGPAPRSAKHSITHTQRLERLRSATMLECRLETGRQHQIRIHLSEAGHPLIGERVYIRDYEGPRIEAGRPMLHAEELGLVHPRSGREMQWRMDPPEDFLDVYRSLGGG